jgi:hypothetical protein
MKRSALKSVLFLMLTLAGCSTNNGGMKGHANAKTTLSEIKMPAAKAYDLKLLPAEKAVYLVNTTGDRPFGVAFNNEGLYMVRAPGIGNGRLSMVDPKGNITEIAPLEGTFMGPGIDTDKDGNTFITLGDNVLKLAPGGKTTVVARGFTRCFAVRADLKGNLYIADDITDTIYKISSTLDKSIVYKGTGTTPFFLMGLTFDKTFENLYMNEGGKIFKLHINKDGVPEKPQLVIDKLEGIRCIVMDNEGNIYATTESNVKKISPKGIVTEICMEPIEEPIGLALGGKGFDRNCLYIALKNGIVTVPFK